MKGKREEAEVIVRLDQQEQKAHICVTSWPAMYRKMLKLYGPSKDHGHVGQSVRWELPLKAISFRRIRESKTPRRVAVLALKRHKLSKSEEQMYGANG